MDEASIPQNEVDELRRRCETLERKLTIVTGMLRDLSVAIAQDRNKRTLQQMAYAAQKYLILGSRKQGG